MTLIKTSDSLPVLKKGERQEFDKKKLFKLADKVRAILEKEGRFCYDKDISSPRDAFSD